MSFGATVFNVMIASPSDVPGERQAVREILYEWNAVHASERKQVLLPVGWETHSAPDMGGHPQAIINKQVLLNCDLLVGIFWMRIGTATAEYASGAVEEIERHIASSKPTMLYFSEAHVRPDAVISKQYRQLQKFKDSCRSRGLYEGFNSVDSFKNKFRNQLHIILNEYFPRNVNEYIKNDASTGFEAKLSKDEQKLLKAVSLDRRGKITKARISAGTYIQTNNIDFIENQSPREVSRWDSVINSLSKKGYINPVGPRGDTYEITREGFQIIDDIEQS